MDNKAFESVAAETNATTSAKELQDFVKKSQVVTVASDVTADTTIVEADWYIIGGSGYVLICD